jgi:NAD kinase
MSQPSSENRIVLVVRRTRLDELIARFNTIQQARFYVEHLGADFSDYQNEDRVYKAAKADAERVLAECGRVHVLDREFLSNYIFGDNDTVVALGQDGLVANVMKYLNDQVLLGVNPDPTRYEGVLLPFTVPSLVGVMPRVFRKNQETRRVTMAQVTLNTGLTLYGVNDLFVGPRSHGSARYMIQSGGHEEVQSSSGVIISTGLGSTGWLRSILSGAKGIVRAQEGNAPDSMEDRAIPWEAEYLQFSVREPWPSKHTQVGLTFGRVTPDQPLIMTSQMPEHGVIFSDGMESDFLPFNSGTKAEITVADRQGLLAV